MSLCKEATPPRRERRTSRPRGGGLFSRAGHAALDRYTSRAPVWSANAQRRAADRIAKGQAKARKAAGLDPRTGEPLPSTKKPVDRRKRALRSSAARHRARMTAAALAAGTVGVLSGVWNWRHPGRAVGHMRRVWARAAGRARAARERRDAAIRGEETPREVPVPAGTVNDPNRRRQKAKAPVGTGRRAARVDLGKTNTRKDSSVSDTTNTAFTRLSDAADVMLQAASTFDPEHMSQFQALIDDLPTAMGTVQETLRVLAEISRDRLPVDPAVVEEIGEGFRAMNRVVAALDEVPTVYRRVHAQDIERGENPRNGIESERKWNV
ncbi:hypothetical protein E1265_18530 [Streptomyces sp. 8K308]|uniref:hypothetical protein n=1 Tax=Streptomyces sp. 8K308 TaxID=2530388 RepID=UPI001047E153|nr:hypothetical protein [Streptomyces sp. 8K308]TDC21249.1 hypothetical protein E1265_18530 [Streptomyces sp. 8K308]